MVQRSPICAEASRCSAIAPIDQHLPILRATLRGSLATGVGLTPTPTNGNQT
jgi:hypothetical protein